MIFVDHLFRMLDSPELSCIVIDDATCFIIFALERLSLNVGLQILAVLYDHHFVKGLHNDFSFVHLAKIVLVHLDGTSVSHDLAWQIVVANIVGCIKLGLYSIN